MIKLILLTKIIFIIIFVIVKAIIRCINIIVALIITIVPSIHNNDEDENTTVTSINKKITKTIRT